MITTFLDPIPMWAMYVLTFLVLLLAFELGYKYGLFRQKKYEVEPDKTLDAMVGATLGLLAFLMAFVMSMASDRYDNRRQLVVEEAQIIKQWLESSRGGPKVDLRVPRRGSSRDLVKTMSEVNAVSEETARLAGSGVMERRRAAIATIATTMPIRMYVLRKFMDFPIIDVASGAASAARFWT